MAISRNTLVPLLGIGILLIVGVVLLTRCSDSGSGHVKSDGPMTQVPGAAKKGADQDTPVETLKTVVAGQRDLKEQVSKVLEENENLRKQLAQERLNGSYHPPAGGGVPSTAPAAPAPAVTPASAPSNAAGASPAPVSQGGIIDTFGNALKLASGAGTATPAQGQPPAQKATAASSSSAISGQDEASYQVVTPMGYAAYTAKGANGAPATTSYVRTSSPGSTGAVGPASRAASAAQNAAERAKPVPYFTLPENATLVGAVSMTSLIGRVPIDGHVTDPMQFKLVVGHDNLAANGFELPDDIAGMIVSGVAIGDMALSCSEGKIQSVTFVFNDGSIRTVSKRNSLQQLQNSTGTSNGGASTSNGLGYISDMHGNPCIQGKFITNAGAFLTDIIAVKGLSAAGQAYSQAQTMTTQSAVTATNSSSITGNVGGYALGQAVAGAGDEVTKWLLAREKNSFDAVVTPSGLQLVVHLDQEIDIDKDPNGRKLVHRSQEMQALTGARYGLE